MVTFAPAALGMTRDDITLGLRPEALHLSQNGALSGTVTHVEYLGADALIDCTVNGETLTCRISGQADVTQGSQVSLGFARKDLHAFDSQTGHRLAHLPSEFEAHPTLQDAGPVGATT